VSQLLACASCATDPAMLQMVERQQYWRSQSELSCWSQLDHAMSHCLMVPWRCNTLLCIVCAPNP